MSYYPIFVDLKGRKVLVVGGGSVAGRKIDTLLEYGAAVNLVSLELSDSLKGYIDSGKIKYLGKEFGEDHLSGMFLVIAATDNPDLNHRISEVAEKKGMLVNAVDQPGDCNFIVPSIIKKGDLTIAISTSGKSPALAKKIRKELTDQFGDEYDLFLKLMGRIRKQVLSEGRSQKENSRIFKKIVNSNIMDELKNGDLENAALILTEILEKTVSTKDIENYIGT
ncbi:bifunctional precorrin-2 dehydrogenase/sirohydrochlorin ferrochelatase [Thermodesulfobacteriota bacterium]